jgi:hypothetical protein
MALAFGQMGLDPAVFWRLSLKEWYEKQRGYYLKLEMQQKAEWERTRWQTWILAIPNARKGSLNTPKDLIRFPWEVDDVVRMTEEEAEYFARKMGRYFNPEAESEDKKFYN